MKEREKLMSSYVDSAGISHEWQLLQGELKTLEVEMEGYLQEFVHVS